MGSQSYSLVTWPHGAPARGSTADPGGAAGGPPEGQDRPPSPNHRVRHPPRWCGSEATPTNLPDSPSVAPLRLDTPNRGENPQIWARDTGAPPKRSDGRRVGHISLRRFTPTPPGGVTQPVVGVAPAVLAPRRAPPGPAEDPPRGRPGGATSVSCTSFYHSFDHSLDTALAGHESIPTPKPWPPEPCAHVIQ